MGLPDEGFYFYVAAMPRHPFRKRCLYPLFSIFLIIASPLYGEEMSFLQREEVLILFEEPLQAGAEEVARVYPIIREDLEKMLGWRVDFIPTVVLIKESKSFQRMTQSPLVVAFAVPERNLIVIDHSKMTVDPFSTEATLKHELSHLLLHHHLRERKAPKWLDEGIAQWVSGGIADIIMSPKRSFLTEATLADRLLSIRSLTDGFPRDRDALFLAYEESKSLVSYIIEKYGIHGIRRVLAHMKEGDGWEEAVQRGLSVSTEELEAAWYHDLRKRLTWFTYLINHLYEILFFLAALMTIFGFARRWWKKRAYWREAEDDPSLPQHGNSGEGDT